MGDRPPDPAAVTIVTDTVGFCRLAANRLIPAELDVWVTGEAGRAADVLAAATAAPQPPEITIAEAISAPDEY